VVMDALFWERIADWYWERAGVPRPGRLVNKATGDQ
jgi:hypothetical protein